MLLLCWQFSRRRFINRSRCSRWLARETPTLVVACGMALVIICRQIDISVGSMFAVCSVCAGLLAAMHWPLALVVMASILIGAIFGAFNGVLIAGLGLPSIVVTLATMVTWRRRFALVAGRTVCESSERNAMVGLSQMTGQCALVIVALAILISLALAMKHLSVGRFIYAVGSDAEAARLSGIRPRLTTFFVFVFMGALVGLAAMMNTVQSPQVDPKFRHGIGTESHRGGRCRRRGDFRRSRKSVGRVRGPAAARVRQPRADASAHRGLLGKGNSRRDHFARRRGGRVAKQKVKPLICAN